jgi:hypothetical protein
VLVHAAPSPCSCHTAASPTSCLQHIQLMRS